MHETGEKQIGRYEILAELGRGAMGVVYKARDPQLDRIVAIKTLRLDLGPELQADLRRRFYQEAMAAGRMNHPAIVAVHDVLVVDETPYIVMEFVEGQTLAHLIAAEGPLAPQRAADLVLQVCGALEFAHARGVVHRDIKPANILVAGGRQVKVSDFGIARIAGSKLTRTGDMIGSPSYMSPEQVRGGEMDGRSDLFSLGVVLYEALSGADPFSGETPSTVLYKIVHVDPLPLQERNIAVSPALDAFLRRALAKEPEQRYPAAWAFADALRQALEPVGHAGAATWTERTMVLPAGPEPARRRAAAIGAGCLLIAAVGGVVLWNRSPEKGKPTPETGPRAATEALRPVAPPPAERAPRRREAAGSQRPSPSIARVPPAAPLAPKREAARGSIRIATNPSVEIFVDGRFIGRAERSPFVIDGVALGRRAVALRLGPVEQQFQGTVLEDQPFSLTYYFPSVAPPAP